MFNYGEHRLIRDGDETMMLSLADVRSAGNKHARYRLHGEPGALMKGDRAVSCSGHFNRQNNVIHIKV